MCSGCRTEVSNPLAHSESRSARAPPHALMIASVPERIGYRATLVVLAYERMITTEDVDRREI